MKDGDCAPSDTEAGAGPREPQAQEEPSPGRAPLWAPLRPNTSHHNRVVQLTSNSVSFAFGESEVYLEVYLEAQP